MKRYLLFWIIAIITFYGLSLGVAYAKPYDKSGVNQMENVEEAVFGTGCFWCTEAIYESIDGVYDVISGYAGGDIANPTYKMVTSGIGNHAEVIRVSYDKTKVSYAKLLEVFWQTHDATTLNRQGNDIGVQYRSIILYKTEHEKELAEQSKIAAQNTIHDKPIVTQIAKLTKFYKAEDYHQDYYSQNTYSNPYCFIVIAPKLKKFKKAFGDILNKEAKNTK